MLDALAEARADALAELNSTLSELRSRAEKKVWELHVVPSLQPLLAPSRYKGAYGGRGGAKSHFFAEQLVRRCIAKPGLRAVCIREVQKSLQQSAKRLIEDKIAALGVEDQFTVLTTHIEAPGGGIIIFQGMQNHTAESMKSLEGFDIAWVEEAQSLSQTSLDMLRPTIRKEGSELWFSWNPTEPTDAVDAFFRKGEPPPSSIIVRTSYADNDRLAEAQRIELEWDRSRDLEKFAHVWLGEYRKRSQASVYKSWKITPADPAELASARFLGLGADWGFAEDPSALLRLYVPADSRRLVIDAEAYGFSVEIEDTPEFFDGLLCRGLCPNDRSKCTRPAHAWARSQEIRADSARPETISYVKRHGYPHLTAANKGPNSVEEGIVFLQGYDIEVDPSCLNTINELTYYKFKTDPKTDKILAEPIDSNNHLLDSARYALEPLRAEEAITGGLLW